MLNLSPSAPLLNPGGPLLVCRIPAFWLCVLVATCVSVPWGWLCLELWYRQTLGWALRRRLFGLVGWLGSPKWVFSCVSWALLCLGRKKGGFLKHPWGREANTSAEILTGPSACGDWWSLACLWAAWLGSLCLCLWHEERGKGCCLSLCIRLTGNCFEVKLRWICVLKRVGFKRLVCS